MPSSIAYSIQTKRGQKFAVFRAADGRQIWRSVAKLFRDAGMPVPTGRLPKRTLDDLVESEAKRLDEQAEQSAETIAKGGSVPPEQLWPIVEAQMPPRAKRTLQSLRHRVKSFGTWAADHANDLATLSDVQARRLIADYLRERRDAVSATTVRNDLRELHRAWGILIRMGLWHGPNPAATDGHELPAREEPQMRRLSPAEDKLVWDNRDRRSATDSGGSMWIWTAA